MRIAGLELKNNVFLAPMAGITDRAFRQICRHYGCGVVYTEMISSKGLYYKDKKTDALMKIYPEEQPAAIQIFGSDPDIIGETAKKAEEAGACLLDINMGCPAPKIVNNGDGCALMRDPALAGRIIEAAVKAVKIPVTVKFRKGFDSGHENALEFAKMSQECGAAAVTVHGRTREQFYSGRADWEVIARIKNELDIPVIGNGDIFSAADAKNMLEYTGCDGVMVARGAEGNPFIFRQIKQLLEDGEVLYEPGWRERLECALWHLSLLVEYKGEIRGVLEARKHLAWYIKGMPNAACVKNAIFSASAYDEMSDIIKFQMSKLP